MGITSRYYTIRDYSKLYYHIVGARVWRVCSWLLRRLPGVGPLLNLPTKKVASLREWTKDYRTRRQDWWERTIGPYYEVLHHETVAKRKMPLTVQQGGLYPPFAFESYKVHSELFLAVIPHARILGPHGVVVTPDGGVVEESAWGLGYLGRDRVSTSLRLPKPTRSKGRYFTIASQGSASYPHWVADALPRLMALDNLDRSELKVIVSGLEAQFQVDSLEKLGITEKEILPLDRQYLETDILFFPSFVGDPGIHPLGCQWLRDRFLPAKEKAGKPRRLYVTRRLASRRRVLNEAEIEPILARYGIEIVEAERLSFGEQVRIFSEAELVIGPHGAGLTNIVFTPKGSKILELFYPDYMTPAFFKISDYVNLEYWYLLCKPAGNSPVLHHWAGSDDMYAPLREFEETVLRLVGSIENAS